jgi:hypothetical protein
VGMGRYLLRGHPGLLGRLDHALKDSELGSR